MQLQRVAIVISVSLSACTENTPPQVPENKRAEAPAVTVPLDPEKAGVTQVELPVKTESNDQLKFIVSDSKVEVIGLSETLTQTTISTSTLRSPAMLEEPTQKLEEDTGSTNIKSDSCGISESLSDLVPNSTYEVVVCDHGQRKTVTEVTTLAAEPSLALVEEDSTGNLTVIVNPQGNAPGTEIALQVTTPEETLWADPASDSTTPSSSEPVWYPLPNDETAPENSDVQKKTKKSLRTPVKMKIHGMGEASEVIIKVMARNRDGKLTKLSLPKLARGEMKGSADFLMTQRIIEKVTALSNVREKYRAQKNKLERHSNSKSSEEKEKSRASLDAKRDAEFKTLREDLKKIQSKARERNNSH